MAEVSHYIDSSTENLGCLDNEVMNQKFLLLFDINKFASIKSVFYTDLLKPRSKVISPSKSDSFFEGINDMYIYSIKLQVKNLRKLIYKIFKEKNIKNIHYLKENMFCFFGLEIISLFAINRNSKNSFEIQEFSQIKFSLIIHNPEITFDDSIFFLQKFHENFSVKKILIYSSEFDDHSLIMLFSIKKLLYLVQKTKKNELNLLLKIVILIYIFKYFIFLEFSL